MTYDFEGTQRTIYNRIYLNEKGEPAFYFEGCGCCSHTDDLDDVKDRDYNPTNECITLMEQKIKEIRDIQRVMERLK